MSSYAPYSSNSARYQQAEYFQASELENKIASTNAIEFIDYYFPLDPTIGSPPQVDHRTLSRLSQNAELFIELVKTHSADHSSSARGRDTRGQVITCLNAIQTSQLRTHSFAVLIIGNRCRLLCLTRSAMVVTTRFDYTNTPFLMLFLWRLSQAPPDVQGLGTFQQVNAGGAHDALPARKLIDAIGKPLRSVPIADDSLYVSHSFTRVRRGARCFPAVEPQIHRTCLLKDTWRVLDYHSEREIYAWSEDMDCGEDDVPLSWSALNAQAARQHQHYRLVLNAVGRPLVEFGSTYELVKCVLDAVQAHSDAWTKAGVEHRDVSVGNIIIIVLNGIARGLLIDWELSRYESDEHARAYERTGTRQFMSARLSATTEQQARELADDLESFLLVLLWVAISYAPGTMDAKVRFGQLGLFDDPTAAGKRLLMSSGDVSVEFWKLSSPHFDQLLRDLINGFTNRYRTRGRLNPGPPLSTDHLKSHDWMLEMVRKALEDATWRALKDTAQAQPVMRREVLGLRAQI
ncbi:hypothetical protein C8F01DRAFT_1028070 [Mycena amicta]|nr:hypothetical protein C8F01DRAFT_1028070 [Mycena amicta]